MPITNWARLFKLANIKKEKFEELSLDKVELSQIFDDFKQIKNDLDALALYYVTKILTFSKVHSVRYRIKDPEHLIAKIIRKKIENSDRVININNYKEEITDLIGVRILHLFKNEYSSIDSKIREYFQISSSHTPIIYKRVGDTINNKKPFDSFEIKDHPRNYRSIHYILESVPAKIKYYIEVQVRTIFEEGWSEIDHKILYPDNLDNSILNEFSMILNSLASSADSMSTQMRDLKLELEFINEEHEAEIQKRDEKIKSLESLINKSNLKHEEKSEIINAFEEKSSILTSYFKTLRSRNGKEELYKNGLYPRSLGSFLKDLDIKE